MAKPKIALRRRPRDTYGAVSDCSRMAIEAGLSKCLKYDLIQEEHLDGAADIIHNYLMNDLSELCTFGKT